MFVFTCPGCRRRLSAPPQSNNQQARCPHCACVVQLSLSATTAQDSTPGPEPLVPTLDSRQVESSGPTADDPLAVTEGGSGSNPEVVTLPTIPGYEVLGVLGRGGMGVVYQARQRSLNRVVALKMVLAGAHATAGDFMRFRAEAEALARVRHPNIVQVFEVGAHDGNPFFSLEFIEGGSLANRVRTAPLTAPQAADIVRQLALAVEAAHQAGVVHRDLKPANVLMTADGLPKITDFGLAKQLDVDVGQTRTGTVMGTPSYMAPEQAQGQVKAMGPLIDVYALGAILYECLTGSPPFRGPTPLETLMQVAMDEPLPPSRLQRSVPRDLETICLKCLEKNPSRRFRSAQALADDLEHFLKGEPIAARPVGAIERGIKWARRKPAVAALSLGLGLSLVVGLALVTVLYVHAEGQRADAVEARAREAKRADSEQEAREDAEQARQTAEDRRVQAEVAKEREQKRAASEAEAHKQADAQRRLAETESSRARRLTATLSLERGRNLCEQGDVAQGMLSFARALELAPADATELRRTAQLSLAVWQPGLSRLRACLTADGNITRAVFSPKSDVVLTGTNRGAVQRWQADTGEPIGGRIEHRGNVRDLAFSPDGELFAVACQNPDQVHVHHAGTGEHIATLATEAGPPLSMAFAGKLLIVGAGALKPDGPGEVLVWDAMKRMPKVPPIKTEGAVHMVALRPGQPRTFATAEHKPGPATTVQLRLVDTGQPTGMKLDVSDHVVRMRFSKSGNALYVNGGGQHRLWDMTSGESVSLWPGGGTNPGIGSDLSPDGRTVIHGSDQYGQYYLADTKSGKTIHRPLRHNGGGSTCVFSPDGRLALTGSAGDRTARLWNAVTGDAVMAPLIHPAGVLDVAFSPDGRTILTRAQDRTVRLWDLAEPTTAAVRRLAGGHSVLFTPDGKLLAGGGPGVQVLDAATLKPAGPAIACAHVPDALAITPDGKTLALAGGNYGGNRVVEVWDLAKPERRHELRDHRGGVNCLAISPDGKLLASGARDRSVRLWDIATGQPAGTPFDHPDSVWDVAFVLDGQVLAAATADGVSLWDLKSRRRLRTLAHEGGARSLCVAQGGKALWVGGGEGLVRRWDLGEMKPAGPSFSVFGSVWSLAMSPDQRFLVTGSSSFEVQLWQAETGHPLGRWLQLASGIMDVKFSPEGKQYAAAGHYAGVNVFRTPEPMEGEAQQVMLRLQVLTGLELAETGRGHALDVATWRARKAALDKANKAP